MKKTEFLNTRKKIEQKNHGMIDKITTLDELKERVKGEIQASLDRDHKDAVRKEIINYFVENSKVDAPESMVSMYLEQIKDDLQKRNQSLDEEQMIENYKPQNYYQERSLSQHQS